MRSSSKASNPTFQPLIGSPEPTPEVLVPVIKFGYKFGSKFESLESGLVLGPLVFHPKSRKRVENVILANRHTIFFLGFDLSTFGVAHR